MVMFAKRYRCKNERIPMCDRGDGSPPRKKCRYCGSEFYIEEGLYGVFDWRGDNLYDPADAKSWHKTDDKASSAAEGEEVSRWVPASMLYPSTNTVRRGA